MSTTTNRFTQPFSLLFLKWLPLFCALIFFFSLRFDIESRFLRLSIFLVFSCVTAVHPKWGLRGLLLSLCWFELPILQMGYPNQFLIETALLGFVATTSLKGFFSDHSENVFTSTAFKNFYLHPFFLPSIFAVLAGTLTFVISFGELAALSSLGISKKVFLQTLLRKIYLWDVRSSVHSLSLVFAYSLHLCFLARLSRDWQKWQLSYEQIITYVSVGAVPVFVFAIGQDRFPHTFTQVFTSDIGGTLQNGNHLSFFAAVVLVLCVQALILKRHQVWWCAFFILNGFLAVKCLLLGMGRSVWIALALGIIAGFIALVLALAMRFRTWRAKFWLTGSIALMATLIGALVVAIRYFSADCDIATQRLCFELGSSISNLQWENFSNMLAISGRRQMLEFVGSVVREYPWSGIGLGNSFVWLKQGLDLHNAFFAWLVELGIFAFVVVLFTSGFFGFKIGIALFEEVPLKILFIRILLITLFTIVLLTSFMDYYLSYRSLALLISILALSAFYLISPLREDFFSPAAFIKWALGSTVIVSIFTAFLTLNAPQNRYPLVYAYPQENQAAREASFNWYSFMYLAPEILAAKQCTKIAVKPLLHSQTTKIHIGLVKDVAKDPGQVRFANLQAWLKENFSLSQTTSLFSQQWHELCICRKTSTDSGRLGIVSEVAHVPSWTKHLPYDDRLLAFAVQIRAWQTFAQPNLKQSQVLQKQWRCPQLFEL